MPPLAQTYQFQITAIDLAQAVTFKTTSWDLAKPTSFDQVTFWQEFIKQHPVTTEAEILELVLDVTRCHFGPKSTSWPGVEITVGYNTVAVTGGAASTASTRVIVLQKGTSKVKNFVRGKGSKFSFTHACLATAGLFEEAFHSDTEGRTACNSIAGSFEGYSQMMGTLNGWTAAHQASAETAFDAFVTTNGLAARDVKVKALIHTASLATINNRTAANSAYGARNVLRLVTGGATVSADNPTKA
jgi:hypothetical protein